MPSKFNKNYTCHDNSSFKISFPNGLTVSTAVHNRLDEYDADDDSQFPSFIEAMQPRTATIYTFNGADVAILDRENGDSFVTGVFASDDEGAPLYDDMENIFVYVTPEQLVPLLAKVQAWKRNG